LFPTHLGMPAIRQSGQLRSEGAYDHHSTSLLGRVNAGPASRGGAERRCPGASWHGVEPVPGRTRVAAGALSKGRYEKSGKQRGQEDAQRPNLNRREEGQFKASSIATDRSFARRREEGDKPTRLTYSGPKGRGLVLWSLPCIK
jgi:hypothetical protein